MTLAAWAVVTASAQQNLADMKVLVLEGDAALQMVEGIHLFLERETALWGERRKNLAAAPDREHFRRIVGAVDRRVQARGLQIDPLTGRSPDIAPGRAYRVYAVRWQVFDDVDAEGLLLMPEGAVKARIVAIPDADSAPRP